MSSAPDAIYALSKFADAVEALATGEGEVRERLITALGCLAPLHLEQLPEGSRAEWKAILARCTKSGPVIDTTGSVTVGSIEHTLGACHKRTAASLAQRIWDLYCDLARETKKA